MKAHELNENHDLNNSHKNTANMKLTLLSKTECGSVFHAFILPSYKEEICLLEETLKKLA